MSDLRDELEKNFASAMAQSEEKTAELKESDLENHSEALSDDELIAAPKSYTKEFQEDFKTLSPEWQKYLSQREKQMEKGFSELGNKLNASKWPDKFFEERKDRLTGLGYQKAKDYIEKLIFLDDAMQEKPCETLAYLAKTYGVKQANDNNVSLTQTQRKMWQEIARANEAFQRRQSDAALFDLNQFEKAVDDRGELKHPFYEKVKDEMVSTLKGGEALNLEEAYQKALWLNENVREQMIEDKIKKILNAKFDEALHAKEVSFSPISKAQSEPKEMTLREELEAQFRKEF